MIVQYQLTLMTCVVCMHLARADHKLKKKMAENRKMSKNLKSDFQHISVQYNWKRQPNCDMPLGFSEKGSLGCLIYEKK